MPLKQNKTWALEPELHHPIFEVYPTILDKLYYRFSAVNVVLM